MRIVQVFLKNGGPIVFEVAEAKRVTSGDLIVHDLITGNEMGFFPAGEWSGYVARDIVEERPKLGEQEKEIAQRLDLLDLAAS